MSIIINIYATILIAHYDVYDYGCETGTLVATITKMINFGLPDNSNLYSCYECSLHIILIINDSLHINDHMNNELCCKKCLVISTNQLVTSTACQFNNLYNMPFHTITAVLRMLKGKSFHIYNVWYWNLE